MNIPGKDKFGNKYYKNKKNERWVIYSGEIEATKISSEWYLWMHHTIDKIPINKVTKFGAFVSLTDELEGFIRTTDFHWTKNPSHPKEFVNEGDSVDYIVLEILEKERKVLLSVKDLTDNPWENIESNFSSGDKIKGLFQKMGDSGALVKLDNEIQGLIPLNEISKDQKKNIISELNEGDSLDLIVVEVKSDEKNITLMLDESNVGD